MDDVQALALAGNLVRWIDEKFGRLAAWIAAALLCLLPIAIIAAAIWYVAG